MPPMRVLVLAMAARRHEERVLVGARALELKRTASVAGGDVCYWGVWVRGDDEGVAEALGMQNDEAVLSLRWCYMHG